MIWFLRTWDEYLGEGEARGIVTFISNKAQVFDYNEKGHPTLHGLELKATRTFPIINEQPHEPWSFETIREYLQDLEAFSEPLIDDPDGGERPHPLRARHLSLRSLQTSCSIQEEPEAEKPGTI